jgi:hypothetical protein
VISFRYHVVSLVAVLLALAVGIVLGGGPLQRDDGSTDELSNAAAVAEREEADASQQSLLAFGDSYAELTSAEVVRDRLRDRPVTMVVLPSAEEKVAEGIAGMVAEAGGEVTVEVELSTDLLDVGNRQLVDELASQMYDDARKDVDVPEDASGYELFSRLLAHAVGTKRDEGSDPDNTAEGILAASSTAELVAIRGEADRRGSLVVVVAGAPHGSADERAGAGGVLSTLVAALDDRTDGVVVAGPLAAAAEDGLVTVVREDDAVGGRVSTVDVADRVGGAVATVLALAEQASGDSGHYGSLDAPDGALPGQ